MRPVEILPWLRHALLRSVPWIGSLLRIEDVGGLLKYMTVHAALRANDIEIILDVGANAGQFAQSMRQIGYHGRIISFEPIPELFDRIQDAARRDSLWSVHNCALGVDSIVKTLHVMANTEFSSFHMPDPTFRHEDLNDIVKETRVTVRRLDEVIDEMGIADRLARCLLKSDTQGHDLAVLQGCGKYLSQIRMINVEVSSVAMYRDVPPMTDLLAFLDRHFLLVNLFPIARMEAGAAYEFDYLGVNRSWALQGSPCFTPGEVLANEAREDAAR